MFDADFDFDNIDPLASRKELIEEQMGRENEFPFNWLPPEWDGLNFNEHDPRL